MDLEIPELPIVGVGPVRFDNAVFPTGTEDLFRHGSGWERSIFMADTGHPVLWFILRRGEFALEIKTDGWMLSDSIRQVEHGEAEAFADVYRDGMAALNRHLFPSQETDHGQA